MKITEPSPIERGEDRYRDLLTHRIGGDDRGRRAAGEDLDRQRLLHPGAAGREGHRARHLVDGEHEQHAFDRAADTEGVEQKPEGGEATHPGKRLQRRDLAQVAAAIAEDRDALTHTRPERLDAHRQQGKRDQAEDRQRGDQEEREAEVLGEVGDVKGIQLGEVRAALERRPE